MPSWPSLKQLMLSLADIERLAESYGVSLTDWTGARSRSPGRDLKATSRTQCDASTHSLEPLSRDRAECQGGLQRSTLAPCHIPSYVAHIAANPSLICANVAGAFRPPSLHDALDT